MLSGVGPAEQVRSHSINVVKDLPGVGTHLMDHVVVDGTALLWFLPTAVFITVSRNLP